jgi:molybdenum cofactor cytidylyltransferase
LIPDKEKNTSINKNTEKGIGLVLLAAGASKRLGTPKQLLQFNGISLLQQSIKTALSSMVSQPVVVLGAHAERLFTEIEKENVQIAINKDWNEGMASSIRCGLHKLLELAPHTEGVILMVCDQPYVSPSLLNSLINEYNETGKPIITCSYGDSFGPPTLFHKSLFGELLMLKGDTGARKVVQQHVGNAGIVLFPEGRIDIDTEEEYKNVSGSM